MTTLPNADVIVKPSGEVIVKRTEDKEHETTGIVENPNELSNKKVIQKVSKEKHEKTIKSYKPQDNQNPKKKKKVVLTIENGMIKEEMVLDKIPLGKQVKKRKVKTDDLEDIKIKLKNKKPLKSSEGIEKKQRKKKKLGLL